MNINDEIIFFDEVVDYPTKPQIEEIKKINKKYMSKHNKQEWLKQEVEKLLLVDVHGTLESCGILIVEETETIEVLNCKGGNDYFYISYSDNEPKIVFRRTFYTKEIKHILEIAEQYKDME